MEFDVKNNRLTELPGNRAKLLHFNKLEYITQRYTVFLWLTSSPMHVYALYIHAGGIGKLRRLVILNITNNHVSRLPASLGRLARLEELGIQ